LRNLPFQISSTPNQIPGELTRKEKEKKRFKNVSNKKKDGKFLCKTYRF